jgi:hypothetical protein
MDNFLFEWYFPESIIYQYIKKLTLHQEKIRRKRARNIIINDINIIITTLNIKGEM